MKRANSKISFLKKELQDESERQVRLKDDFWLVDWRCGCSWMRSTRWLMRGWRREMHRSLQLLKELMSYVRSSLIKIWSSQKWKKSWKKWRWRQKVSSSSVSHLYWLNLISDVIEVKQKELEHYKAANCHLHHEFDVLTSEHSQKNSSFDEEISQLQIIVSWSILKITRHKNLFFQRFKKKKKS